MRAVAKSYTIDLLCVLAIPLGMKIACFVRNARLHSLIRAFTKKADSSAGEIMKGSAITH